MTKPRMSIVVAVTRKDAAIGRGGKLLFHISDDLKRFKKLTLGHPVIMGRKTYESIGHPLPDRTNIVVTRNPDLLRSNLACPPKARRRRGSGKRFDLEKSEGVIVVNSLEDAIKKAEEAERLNLKSGERFNLQDSGEIFIIGGGEIYKQVLPYTDKLYLTLVESDAKGDVFFPDWRTDFTKETFRENRIDPKTGLKYTWVDLERA